MTKLNVTVPAVDVEVNGVKYRKVDRDAQVGDIILFTGEDDYVTTGAFYAVARVDSWGDPHIDDNDGDDCDLSDVRIGGFEVYAKVSGTSTEYREVKRWAEPGERIRIVRKASGEDRYKNGAEFVVDSVDGDGDVRVTVGTRDNVLVELREYTVLESATAKEPAPKRLTVGDYAKVVEKSRMFTTEYVSVGDVVKITEDDGLSRPFKADTVGGKNAGWFTESELIRATDEEVAEAKRKLAAVTTTTDSRSQFAKGEKVRLISGGDAWPLYGFTNGNEYVVADPTPSSHGNERIQISQVSGRGAGYAKPEQLAKLTIEVGSTVRLTIKDGEKPEYGWGNVSNEAIGTVTNIYGTSAYVNFPEQRWWHALLSESTLVTDGEKPQPQPEPVRFKVGEYARTLVAKTWIPKGSIVKITRDDEDSNPFRSVLLDGSANHYYTQDELERLDAETAKWASIGRKVNEFKDGDVVQVVDDSCLEVEGAIKNGDIVTLEYAGADMFRLQKTGVDGGNYASPHRFKLITPVEQRFDRMELTGVEAKAAA
ncbi:hypothetical protein ABFT51_17780 [Paenibacillus peoriae]|uniref:hypothetical protein n=1 Tax=Paenibacillus peoriae TaxID=59893 RepID=UPI0032AF3F94